jgi:hypothetical protein
MIPKAECPHEVVRLHVIPTIHGDDVTEAWWCCDECEQEFAPVMYNEKAQRLLDALPDEKETT